jgi:ubiquinone/menaquinone biosynthesis C-methylase UbiE
MINIKDKELLKMPIDQFGRYFLASSIIQELSAGKPIRILDIGGYRGSLHKFFNASQVEITILDVFDIKEPGYIKGNALALPFADKEFDFTVSFEVFEHIPHDDRKQYISEAIRVAKRSFIMSAPLDSKDNEVLKSEILLNTLWRYIHKEDHEWLKEHIEYKTPQIEELEKILNSFNASYKKIGNNDLTLWNFMQSLAFLTTTYKHSGQNPAAQEFYNKNIDILEGGETSFYRYIYIIGEDAKHRFKSLNLLNDEKRKQQIIYELINISFTSVAGEVKKLTAKNTRQKTKILEQKSEIVSLGNELKASKQEVQNIKSSASWQLAQKLSKAGQIMPGKKIIKNRIKNGK